ncbi:hypothetical protein MNBD_IGNAVI01-2342 [hydrothermal vent metagenome]|uniref:LptD C-terminal domain-containing protein n=1 Tax=hydrothermal vent metagenome TaxID=652676 RepID=A0A3B1BX62_9ZZZZ
MKTKFLVFAAMLLFQTFITAQNFNGRISSSVYSFERHDVTESYQYLRTFQSLMLNANYGKFSIKTRVNYETDVAKKLVNDPRVRFYNLYLEGRNLFDLLSFRVGRISLFNNVSSGTYDGGDIKFKYKGYKLHLFYGGNVPAYQKFEITNDWKNNYVFSGKLDITAVENFRFALSYVDKNYTFAGYETIRLDENLNPMVYLIQNHSNQYKFASGEISYRSPKAFNLFARYDYDLNFNTTSRIEFNGRYDKVKDWGFTLYYNYRAPKIRYNSIFAVFDFANTHEIEGGVEYKINTALTVVGKFGNVIYKDDNSQRFTIGLNSTLGSISYRKTFGYAGELDAISLYTAKTFLEGLLTPSIGLGYTSYKLSADSETSKIISLLAGFNVRPLRVLSFDLQGQFFNNKIYKDDYRLLFKLNYWFNVNI